MNIHLKTHCSVADCVCVGVWVCPVGCRKGGWARRGPLEFGVGMLRTVAGWLASLANLHGVYLSQAAAVHLRAGLDEDAP